MLNGDGRWACDGSIASSKSFLFREGATAASRNELERVVSFNTGLRMSTDVETIVHSTYLCPQMLGQPKSVTVVTRHVSLTLKAL